MSGTKGKSAMKTTRYIQNGVDGNFIVEVISGAPVQAANEVERITRDGKTYERVGTGDFFAEVKTPEPDLVSNIDLSVQELAVVDLRDFGQVDFEYRFGTESQSLNSTGALVDAYEGALELVLSLRKAIYIKTGK